MNKLDRNYKKKLIERIKKELKIGDKYNHPDYHCKLTITEINDTTLVLSDPNGNTREVDIIGFRNKGLRQ